MKRGILCDVFIIPTSFACRWLDTTLLAGYIMRTSPPPRQALGTLVCTTLTLPTGALIPSFKVGVAIGRLLGEFYCSHRGSVCLANPAVASKAV